MTARKGQRYGASLEQLRAAKAIDARNAGYRSVGRGDTGEEPRYLAFRTANPEAFAQGRKDAEETISND